ncbi:MAG: hypothetical protein K0R61_3618 [Microvirga sp.]|jgi:hypothetical protein|nr:hypothetical protein [Microvirga sp.]
MTKPRKRSILPDLTGNRIELDPATDAWMSGDRYGEIIKTGVRYYSVKMDVSRRVLLLRPENILEFFCEA